MVMKSISLTLHSQSIIECETSLLTIPFSDTLSTLRGGSFFTSAYSIPFEGKGVVFRQEDHYDRLVSCYSLLYSRLDFPIKRDQFGTYLDRLLSINPVSNDHQMQILVVVLGGNSVAQGHGEWSFLNGFEGDISEIVFIAQPMAVKPQWSFKYGINVMTHVYQRPSAHAKPTVYQGGIQGQWTLTYRNMFFLLAKHYECHEDQGDDGSGDDLLRLMALSREVKAHNISFLQLYSFQSSYFESLIQRWLSDNDRPDISELEARYMRDIIHDVVFMSPKGYLLEGSTFSLLALDHQLRWVFIPIDSDQGSVLESITVRFIKSALDFASIPYDDRLICLDERESLAGLFAVSSTRLMRQVRQDKARQDNVIGLQRIRCVDGCRIGDDGVFELAQYNQLTDVLYRYQERCLQKGKAYSDTVGSN
jgi:hypothetical protein